MSFEVYNNQSIASGGGADIQPAQFISSKSAKAVPNRQLLQNAVRTLAEGGIEAFLGNTGILREVLQKYKNGS